MKKLLLALVLGNVLPAEAVTTYDFNYEGTQHTCVNNECGPDNPFEGTLSLTLTGGESFSNWTIYGSTWDGYTGRQVDPNTEIAISVDGHSPLQLNNNVSVDVLDGKVLDIFGNAGQYGPITTTLYSFNVRSFNIGQSNPDRSVTLGNAILTAVPEPSSLALMFAGLTVVAWRHKKAPPKKG